MEKLKKAKITKRESYDEIIIRILKQNKELSSRAEELLHGLA